MRTTNIGMIALGVVVVAVTVAVPGIQIADLVLGGALAAWATFGLLTEE